MNNNVKQFVSNSEKHLTRLLLFASCVASDGVYSVDDDALWLPKKYAALYLDLKEAANVAQSLDRCEKVLRATIDLDRSKTDHPIFRVLCRQPNGKSYNEMVDGKMMVNLTTVVNLSEDWNTCNDLLNDKITLMMGVEILTTEMPEPSVQSDDLIGFEIDFNGKNAQGDTLRYTAKCRLSEDRQIIKVKPRKNKHSK